MKHLLLSLALIISANAWAEEGTTYKDLFEQIKDELTTLRCSGNTSTTISFIGETPVEESTGTYSEYYYFNDDFFYRNRMGRIEALGEFRVFEGWKAIPFHSEVWIGNDEMVFNLDYPQEYLEANPVPEFDPALMKPVSERHRTKIDRNTGEHNYSYHLSNEVRSSGKIVYREDIWKGTCEVMEKDKKF